MLAILYRVTVYQKEKIAINGAGKKAPKVEADKSNLLQDWARDSYFGNMMTNTNR